MPGSRPVNWTVPLFVSFVGELIDSNFTWIKLSVVTNTDYEKKLICQQVIFSLFHNNNDLVNRKFRHLKYNSFKEIIFLMNKIKWNHFKLTENTSSSGWQFITMTLVGFSFCLLTVQFGRTENNWNSNNESFISSN